MGQRTGPCRGKLGILRFVSDLAPPLRHCSRRGSPSYLLRRFQHARQRLTRVPKPSAQQRSCGVTSFSFHVILFKQKQIKASVDYIRPPLFPRLQNSDSITTIFCNNFCTNIIMNIALMPAYSSPLYTEPSQVPAVPSALPARSQVRYRCNTLIDDK